jgi:hypothetical protein
LKSFEESSVGQIESGPDNRYDRHEHQKSEHAAVRGKQIAQPFSCQSRAGVEEIFLKNVQGTKYIAEKK